MLASVYDSHPQKASVVCLDAQTGEERWCYPVRNSIKNTVVAAEGIVVVQDADGNCYALDAVSGTYS